MWNRLSLRLKITFLTALSLCLVTACITGISIYNAKRNFVIPFKSLSLPDDGRKVEIQIESEVPFSNNNDNVNYIIGKSQDDFRTQSIIIAVVFIFIGTIGAYIISGQTLKPILSLTDKIEEIDEHNLKTQIKTQKNSDEVSRLTRSFNNMLSKLDHSFESQRLFAQNAAHELKTPLASIMANIDVLQMDDKPSIEEFNEVIQITKENIERLSQLVHDLLSLNARLDEENMETFKSQEMLENIINDLRYFIEKKKICVSINGATQLRGDKNLITRAFYNLIQNAIRYNKDGGKIMITVKSDVIIIEDTGIGIPEDCLETVFEPFFCVDRSRSKSLGGTGLGLCITKTIFDKHGIRIKAESELQLGTKIIVEL